MDFALSAEQQSLKDSVTRFCERNYDVAKRHALLSSTNGFSKEHWQAFADLGWLGAGLSEADGGFGGSAIENTIIMECFGRALVLEPFVSSAIHAVQTLVAIAQSEISTSLIAQVISGERRLAIAHSEPASRGDLAFCETGASCSQGRYAISGHKSLVFGAPSADRLIVSARIENGIALFLVDPCAKGVRMQTYRTLDNQRVADVWFDSCEVEYLLAPPESASEAISHGYNHAILSICAEAVGIMDASIFATRDYLKTRKQFGAQLGTFQALQHRMADMLVEYELSRSIVLASLASLANRDPNTDRSIAATKAFVSSAALFVGRNAVQLHGAMGVTEECQISHFYRRLFVIAGQFGNEAFHLKQLAESPFRFWPDEPDLKTFKKVLQD